MKHVVQQTLQGILDADMRTCCAPAAPSPSGREEIRMGSWHRLRTRVGAVALRIPVQCPVGFRTQLFARYHANETEILLALVRMYVRGLPSPDTVHAIAERVCGRRLRGRAAARLAQRLRDAVSQWMRRQTRRERSATHVASNFRARAFHGEI